MKNIILYSTEWTGHIYMPILCVRFGVFRKCHCKMIAYITTIFNIGYLVYIRVSAPYVDFRQLFFFFFNVSVFDNYYTSCTVYFSCSTLKHIRSGDLEQFYNISNKPILSQQMKCILLHNLFFFIPGIFTWLVPPSSVCKIMKKHGGDSIVVTSFIIIRNPVIEAVKCSKGDSTEKKKDMNS